MLKVKKKKGASFEKPGGFKYKKRAPELWKKRTNQRGGLFDNPIKDDFPTFSIKEGGAKLRFMPPTWDGAEHYGMDVYVHFGVGPDEQTYVCIEKMRGAPGCPKDEICPVCEEGRNTKDAEYAKSLEAKKRVAAWVIDRKHPEDGPKVYVMPWTIDKDITAVAVDEDSNELLALDDPEEGFDISFKREGKGMQTKYNAFKTDRRPSPLSESPKKMARWLAFIEKHPLPSTIQYFDADHIRKSFEATTSKIKKKGKKGKDRFETREERTGEKKFKSKKSKLKKSKRVDSDNPLDDDAPRKFKKSKFGKKKKLKRE